MSRRLSLFTRTPWCCRPEASSPSLSSGWESSSPRPQAQSQGRDLDADRAQYWTHAG